ncbi:type I restriction-modification system specificity subunit S [Lactiplantibacillus paraplantarum]|uniref:Type I restriction-modification system specificity subunit S n=1 Tax=Lactiplantibacillus paraplantarum TaxID=60520 RepID=A0ABQ0NEA9_9LACO|nr:MULTISPECIES: restriction endonuclease subunit S [Lactiplantibacillus]MBP5841321.1 restriction endonuclease subunit S [Lactiplantibacillus plantarum]WAI60086.1 restriction endonuclease subunit S [Lactiplantibacillus plantarum]GBF03398.1 type I restriction-modification system specificity subunit S [Lactiplantibacillus paraplantarum]
MNDNQSKYPQLRFKGFTDPWEERKLGEFSDVRDGTHASPKYVSQGHPMVTSKNLTHSGLDMTDVSFLTDKDFNEINKRSKVSIGDILFGMIGTIGNPVIVDRDDFAIKNVALIKEKTSNPITNKWLLQYLKSPSFNRFIQKENAGGTQKFIALGLIRDMKLRVPEFDEQQKIGAFFKKIDDTIALHQRKLAKLKELKQGYLQKMFPQNGSKFPQLRFSVLADAWEQRKLSDAVDNIGTGKSKYMLQEKSDLAKYEVLGSTSVIGYDEDYNHEGDFILTARVGANAGNLYHHSGKVKITDNTVFIQGKNLAFIYNLLTQFDLKKLSFGTGQPLVKASELKNLILYFPNNDEQAKIGSYFKQLDHLITLHQRKLEKLQELKKGYLQKMFC